MIEGEAFQQVFRAQPHTNDRCLRGCWNQESRCSIIKRFMLIRFIEDRRFRVVVIVLGWAVWGLLRIVENWSLVESASFALSAHVLKIGLVALGWAIATPFMLWLVERMQRVSLWKSFVCHVAMASALIVFRAALHAAILRYIFESPAPFTGGFYELTSYFIESWWYTSYVHYGFIVSAYSAMLWFKQYRESELQRANLSLKSEVLERQVSDARLTALRMQLNPHFLFNTLHSVAALVRIQDKTNAIQMLSLLGDMLRYTVYEGTKNMVTVREEIAFIKGYLSIEEMRFQDRLRVHWDVEEAALDCVVPNLLLQPLVENSLKHGLAHAQGGVLEIIVRRMEETISIEIRDNGTGLPDGWAVGRGKGIGLQNTRARLGTIYADDFRFLVANHPGGRRGVRVAITLPYRSLTETVSLMPVVFP